MDDVRQTENNEFPNTTPFPSDSPVPVSEVDQVDNSEGYEDRAVYDGDISDSILAKLSAYYNEHGDEEEYVILRVDQYNYYLVFGDYNNGLFSNATTVLYHSQSSYSTNDCRVTVQNGVQYRPDLTGDTGYIYSSLPSFIPSRYISTKTKRAEKMSMVTTVIIVLSFLVAIIGIWCSKMRKRWL